MATTEELLPQQQQQHQSHSSTHHHPGNPHESYSPPQTDRRKYSGEPIAHIGFASKDRNRYHFTSTYQRSTTSPTGISSMKPSHSKSPRQSLMNSYSNASRHSIELSAHDIATSALENSDWSKSRASPSNSQDPHTTSPAAAFRPQPRASPIDPSLSSSSSSASPSPSISTITAASTPMTTDGIAAVTKGTAAASLSDSRPNKYQGSGKSIFLKEEPNDRYERLDEHLNSPTRGMVQPAIERLSGSQEIDIMIPQQLQRRVSQLSSTYGSDEKIANTYSSAKLQRNHSPDYTNLKEEHHSLKLYDAAQSPSTSYEPPYQYHPSGNRRSNGAYLPPSTTTTSITSRPRYLDFEPRRPSSHYPPTSSPRIMANDESTVRERAREWPPRDHHRDPCLDTAETLYEQDHDGDTSYSPPAGSYSYDAHRSSRPSFYHPLRHRHSPYHHQSYSNPQQYSPCQSSHPPLQQQQQPPPLYDPVRESDQRTTQHAGTLPSVYPSYPEPHSPREAYYYPQRRAFVSVSGYPEDISPKQANSQQPQQQKQSHGLVARPERLTSPGPSHPYHSLSNPYHSYSADVAITSHSNAQHCSTEDDIRLIRPSQPSHSHDQRHFYPSLSPQPHLSRYPKESVHNQTHTYRSSEYTFDGHSSQERAQGQGLERNSRDMPRGFDGRWDDESQFRIKQRREDYDTISEPQQASLIAAAAEAGKETSYRRDSQRGIRTSVSDSDLASIELKRDRERRHDRGSLGGSGSEQADRGDYGKEYEGQLPLRMLPPLHPRQLPALLPYHTTRPGSNNSAQPKVPMRRGPYLSKQRALLAGYELPSPSSRYQCQYCSKRFSRPSSLRIHTYSHTGERPFKCSEAGCGRQFSVQSNMRRHLRVHRMGRIRLEYSEHDRDQDHENENENEHDQEDLD
ncbi:hypothetical protein FBU30_004883 [Linnemannia zychae]|nr:hypothetical protein FBU30_004883 [Linnemannia zychae]